MDLYEKVVSNLEEWNDWMNIQIVKHEAIIHVVNVFHKDGKYHVVYQEE